MGQPGRWWEAEEGGRGVFPQAGQQNHRLCLGRGPVGCGSLLPPCSKPFHRLLRCTLLHWKAPTPKLSFPIHLSYGGLSRNFRAMRDHPVGSPPHLFSVSGTEWSRAGDER